MSEINSRNHKPDGASDSSGDDSPHLLEPSVDAEQDREAIAHELQGILGSPPFRASKRSQQFLTYVVQYRLDGNLEPLKERTIGTDLFKRPAGYATGDDSVVRVQAGEVRRRLEQYYQAPPADSQVHIELPLGSYAPNFRWASTAASSAPSVAASEPDSSLANAHDEDHFARVPAHWKKGPWVALTVASLAAIAALAGFLVYRANSPRAVLDQFWSPVFATSRPALICLPKPISYRPSIALFNRNAKTPGEFDSEVDRMNARPSLKPDDELRWSDMIEYSDLGVGKGDVQAGFRLSGLLTRLGKDTEVRIGNGYSFDDLRNSPAILIGAFSNRWSMEMTSGLHFAFAEDHGVFRIQEQGPKGRSFYAHLDRNSAIVEDYGIVTRLVKSGTGQFVVAIAGITSDGSEAAADIASSPEDLAKALHAAPSDWPRKNVQILVKTTVRDSVAGPAQVVAIYVW